MTSSYRATGVATSFSVGGKQQDSLFGGPGIDECNGGTTGNEAPEADVANECEVTAATP